MDTKEAVFGDYNTQRVVEAGSDKFREGSSIAPPPYQAGTTSPPLLPTLESIVTDNIPDSFKDNLHYCTGVYFVLTGSCQKRYPPTPCNSPNLPDSMNLIFGEKHYNAAVNTPVGSSGNIGIRIIDSAVQGKENRHKYVPTSVYVYCAPCVCLIHTGLAICRETPSSTIDFILRPDPRLTSSCHHKAVDLDGLRALVDLYKEEEKNPGSRLNTEQRKDLEYIDRVWIEQAIFEVEDNEGKELLVNDLEHIVEQHPANNRCYGIVILGEFDKVTGMMNTPPFPYKTRRPKETEIYHMKKLQPTVDDKASHWERKFLGTYTAKDS